MDGPISSIRIENIRDGLEDYEYLYKYAEKYGLSAARTKASEVSWSMHDDPSFTHDPDQVQQTRDDLAGLISAP